MLQITFYETSESVDLKTINYPGSDKKLSFFIKQWEDDYPKGVYMYSRVIDK